MMLHKDVQIETYANIIKTHAHMQPIRSLWHMPSFNQSTPASNLHISQKTRHPVIYVALQ